MTLRVVGAGLGRTGTHSLKVALEQLLGGRCYHMLEVIEHPEYAQYWNDALAEEPLDWAQVMNGYVACVDWPAAAYWHELSQANPDAIVLLSTRADADEWYESFAATIAQALAHMPVDDFPRNMLADKFTADWQSPEGAKNAYLRHNERVRAQIAPKRLVEWQPGDGWDPLCRALGVPVPDAPFPHLNTTDDFRAMLGLGAEPSEPPKP